MDSDTDGNGAEGCLLAQLFLPCPETAVAGLQFSGALTFGGSFTKFVGFAIFQIKGPVVTSHSLGKGGFTYVYTFTFIRMHIYIKGHRNLRRQFKGLPFRLLASSSRR